jgi:hypothetical protein
MKELKKFHEMIRGVDFITIEVYGLNQSSAASVEECQELLDDYDILKDFKSKVLEHRKGTGFVDVALFPKDNNKREFIEHLKKLGLNE